MKRITSLISLHFPAARLNEPLSAKTTFGLGGQAAGYLEVSQLEELLAAVTLANLNKIPYRLLAGGSNVVFSDRFYPGLIFHCWSSKDPVRIGGGEVVVSAGVPLASLIDQTITQGLAGLEMLSGIPGSVGGAVVGNAGAYGQSISDHLLAVQAFDGKKLSWLEKDDCQFAYRDSAFKHGPPVGGWLVLRARFKLLPGNKSDLLKKSLGIIATREKKYPPTLKCPGSFFKNVLVKDVAATALAKIDETRIVDGKIPAGYLLEAVGAKGLRRGGIFVADYHGNLLINNGAGTYREVRLLAEQLKRRVLKKFGVELEEEVRYFA